MGAVIKIIAIVLLFTGCKTKQIPVFVERVIKDSIVIRDTLTEVKLEPYFEERTTRDTTSYLTNKYAYSEAKLSNGELYHNLGIWDKPILAGTIKITQYKTIKEPVPYAKEVYVEKELTSWQKFRLGFANIVLIGIAITTILLIIKKKLK